MEIPPLCKEINTYTVIFDGDTTDTTPCKLTKKKLKKQYLPPAKKRDLEEGKNILHLRS